MSQNFASIKQVLDAYKLSYKVEKFIDIEKIVLMPVSDWFKAEIEFSLTHCGQEDKEAFLSEFIIVPFLKEIWKQHPALSLFSHPTLSIEDMTVIPDYLLTAADPSGYKSVYKPLLLTIEAKNEKFNESWKQALLQAIVCQKLNATTEIPIFTIVTTGHIWEFGKLEQQVFTYHPLPLSVQDMGRLLGILEFLYLRSESYIN